LKEKGEERTQIFVFFKTKKGRENRYPEMGDGTCEMAANHCNGLDSMTVESLRKMVDSLALMVYYIGISKALGVVISICILGGIWAILSSVTRQKKKDPDMVNRPKTTESRMPSSTETDISIEHPCDPPPVISMRANAGAEGYPMLDEFMDHMASSLATNKLRMLQHDWTEAANGFTKAWSHHRSLEQAMSGRTAAAAVMVDTWNGYREDAMVHHSAEIGECDHDREVLRSQWMGGHMRQAPPIQPPPFSETWSEYQDSVSQDEQHEGCGGGNYRSDPWNDHGRATPHGGFDAGNSGDGTNDQTERRPHRKRRRRTSELCSLIDDHVYVDAHGLAGTWVNAEHASSEIWRSAGSSSGGYELRNRTRKRT
jgi:hypothetical protein